MRYQPLSEDGRKRVAKELEPVLADLINLSLMAKQAHWNVVGPLFTPLHAQLDAVVKDGREWADQVAERLVAIGVPAEGQVETVAKRSTLEPLPAGSLPDQEVVTLVADRIGATAARARGAMERLSDGDLVSQDLLIGIVHGLEKHLWMVRAQQK